MTMTQRGWFLLDWIVEAWIKRCPHNDRDVAADILEGCSQDTVVKYCRRCGAIRHQFVGQQRPTEWRIPRPTWCEGTRP